MFLGETFIFTFAGELSEPPFYNNDVLTFFGFDSVILRLPNLGILTFSTGSLSSSLLSYEAYLFCCFSNYFCLNSSNLRNFSALRVFESKPISRAIAYLLSSS